MKLETGVPTVKIVNALSKEPAGLSAVPFFNGGPYLIIVYSRLLLKMSIIVWSKNTVIGR